LVLNKFLLIPALLAASAKQRQRYTGMDSSRVILPETLRVNAKVVPDRFMPTLFSQYGGELDIYTNRLKFMAHKVNF